MYDKCCHLTLCLHLTEPNFFTCHFQLRDPKTSGAAEHRVQELPAGLGSEASTTEEQGQLPQRKVRAWQWSCVQVRLRPSLARLPSLSWNASLIDGLILSSCRWVSLGLFHYGFVAFTNLTRHRFQRS